MTEDGLLLGGNHDEELETAFLWAVYCGRIEMVEIVVRRVRNAAWQEKSEIEIRSAVDKLISLITSEKGIASRIELERKQKALEVLNRHASEEITRVRIDRLRSCKPPKPLLKRREKAK